MKYYSIYSKKGPLYYKNKEEKSTCEIPTKQYEDKACGPDKVYEEPSKCVCSCVIT